MKVNNNEPAAGRNAVTKVAESFMTAFPDMVISMDELITTDEDTEYHWTLTGTNTGLKGTGKSVRVSGFELWQFNDEELIGNSIGTFNTDESNRLLKFGVNNH